MQIFSTLAEKNGAACKTSQLAAARAADVALARMSTLGLEKVTDRDGEMSTDIHC